MTHREPEQPVAALGFPEELKGSQEQGLRVKHCGSLSVASACPSQKGSETVMRRGNSVAVSWNEDLSWSYKGVNKE